MNTLYYDCFCGISDDMNPGALIDLGVDPDHLHDEPKKLNIDQEVRLDIQRGMKNGISGTEESVKPLSTAKPAEDGRAIKGRNQTAPQCHQTHSLNQSHHHKGDDIADNTLYRSGHIQSERGSFLRQLRLKGEQDRFRPWQTRPFHPQRA